MASKERPNLTSDVGTRLDEVRQRERQRRLAQQLALNAEIRKRWVEANRVETFQSQRVNDYALLPAALPSNLQQ